MIRLYPDPCIALSSLFSFFPLLLLFPPHPSLSSRVLPWPSSPQRTDINHTVLLLLLLFLFLLLLLLRRRRLRPRPRLIPPPPLLFLNFSPHPTARANSIIDPRGKLPSVRRCPAMQRSDGPGYSNLQSLLMIR
jgi:hypothetical protein